jgi:hypothetical protein
MSLPDEVASKPDPLSQIEIFPIFGLPDPFEDKNKPDSVKLQKALNDALTAVASAQSQVLKDPRTGKEKDVFPIPFTIADISSGTPPFPSASYNGAEVDFIASEAKVAAMYAAFELRDLVRRFRAAPGVTDADVFDKLKKFADPQIIAEGPELKKGEDISGSTVAITDTHRKPHYDKVFALDPLNTTNARVDFTGDYINALEDMIIKSNDEAAATVIHGIGYSYLNGIVQARGFSGDLFNPTQGIWLAADYVGKYPKVRGALSVNDGPAGIAGTTDKMARLVAMISIKKFASIDPGDIMRNDLLHQAAISPDALRPWISFGDVHDPAQDTDAIPQLTVELNKLGVARLGRREEGPNVFSEVSVINGVPLGTGLTSRRFVVAWQNLSEKSPYIKVNATRNGVISSVIPQIIRTTIKAFQTGP